MASIKNLNKWFRRKNLLFMRYDHEISSSWLSSTVNLCVKSIHLICGFNQKCKPMILSQKPTLYELRQWKFFIVNIIDSKLVCKICVKSIHLIYGFNKKCKQMILPQETDLYELRPWKFSIVTLIDNKLVFKTDLFHIRLQPKMYTNDFAPGICSLWCMAMKILHCDCLRQ